MLRYAAKIVTRKVGFTAKCPRATLDSDCVMHVLRWAVRNGPALMIHTILLAALGIVLIGVLSAILETIGLKNHPWIARILAALCVGVAAYIHWGYHSWWVVLIVIAFAFIFLQVLRGVLGQPQKSSH